MYSSSEVHERLWLIQRATEKEQWKNAHDCHTFTLTKPFPALLRESSIAARSSSSTSTIHSECQQKRVDGFMKDGGVGILCRLMFEVYFLSTVSNF